MKSASRVVIDISMALTLVVGSVSVASANDSRTHIDHMEGDEPYVSDGPTRLAQQVLPRSPDKATVKNHALNINMVKVAIGQYSGGYEYFSDGHGYLLEGSYDKFDLGFGVDVTYVSGAAGYRRYWRGKQDSVFIGAMAGYSRAIGGRDLLGYNIQLLTTSLSVIGHVGKRWVFDSGLNVTTRVGAGYAHRTFRVEIDAWYLQPLLDAFARADNFLPLAVDAEVSVGFAF